MLEKMRVNDVKLHPLSNDVWKPFLRVHLWAEGCESYDDVVAKMSSGESKLKISKVPVVIT